MNPFKTVALAGLVLMLTGVPALADIHFTEVQSINVNTHQDIDGDFTDYIELFNNGNQAVNLDGWFLTDDPLNLMRWEFPAVTIQPNGFLLVYASEKNRRNPNSELHTNFRLAGDGEYLALVESDGTTIHTQFAPTLPKLFPGISYGLSQDVQIFDLILEGADATYSVPASGSSSTAWTQINFDDGSWDDGATPLGYDTTGTYDPEIATDVDGPMRNDNSTIYTRFPFEITDANAIDELLLYMKYDDGFQAYLNGTKVAGANAPSNLTSSSNATAEHGTPDSSTVSHTFSGGGTSYTLTAHGPNSPPQVRSGGPTGSYLQLMPNGVNSLQNTCAFNVVPGPSDEIFVEFDYRMPTNGQADGFAFALLETATHGNTGAGPAQAGWVWERPAIDGAFAVGFDIWPAGEENSINLNWDGSERSSRFVNQFELHNGVFNRVNITITQDGPDSLINMTVITDVHGNASAPISIFNNSRIVGMNIAQSRVCFGGRTGGATTAVDLDNVKVDFTAGGLGLQYEEFDITEHLNLLVDGTNVLAIHGLNRTDSDEDFILAPELYAVDAGALQTASRLYFDTPTPGDFNTGGYPGVVEDPVFSRPGGAYPSSTSVAITSATPGATIRYTTNGDEPDESSTILSGSLSITSTRLVKAKAFKDGLLPSSTVTQLYMRLSSNVRNFDSNLPIVIVDTRGRGIGSGSYTEGQAIIVDVDETTGRAEITDEYDFGGTIGMKQRGSSSSGFPKKQWAMEIWDENNEDTNASILGMPSESDWILYAPYSDKSLMRNFLSYKWSNDIGRYAVRTRLVELFLNLGTGNLSYTSHYHGVYVLMEKIKRDDSRVDIDRLTPGDNSLPEISGGYIVKKDRLDPGDSGFRTNSGHTLAYYEPKENEITNAQDNFLQGLFDDFETALFGANFRDPVNGYARYFDVGASIDHHIMVEICKNIDGYRLSTFAHIPRNGLITMGPIWDYNLSLGNANYLNGWIPQGWYYELIGGGDYPWYSRLFQDADYVQKYIDRWAEIRKGPFQTDTLLADIDATAAKLAEAQVRNFDRWDIIGSYVWPNPNPIPTSYAGEIAFMKNWLQSRVNWMDSVWLKAPVFSEENQIIAPGYELFMTAPTGSIYYTTDGSDPRLPGGGISPTATEYGSSASAILLSDANHNGVRTRIPTSSLSGTGWTARTFNDNTWDYTAGGIGVGYERGSGYDPFIDADVEDMYDTNRSVYARYEFDVDDPDEFSFLTLEMRYDDGFIAYLNGTRITSSNGPNPGNWNSGATAQHDDGQATNYISFDVSDYVDELVAGTNVLAIHGLNFTVDSSDLLISPRLSASGAFSGDAITLDDFAQVNARTYSNNSWSAPTQSNYALDEATNLRITEIFYHPPNPDEGSPYSDEDFEYIEFQNVGASTIDLRGVKLANGVDFDFTDSAITLLPPGEYVVIVKNLAAFSTVFNPVGIPIAGEYDGLLENQGERVRLENAVGDILMNFRYNDSWYPITDGQGRSLVLVDPDADPATWDTEEGWAPSDIDFGTPGSGETFEGGLQLLGDANQDSLLDIGDAVSTLLLLYRGEARPLPCTGANVNDGGNVELLDLNQDQAVDSSDVIYLLNFLYLDGAPPEEVRCVRIIDCPSICQ